MSIQSWADIELKRGKSGQASVSWGRRVLQAIDLDDYIALAHLMDVNAFPEASIDTQTTSSGYADYLWTLLIHQYLGDTALHFALRQKRLNCVYILLLLNADTNIRNKKQQTAADLCLKLYGQTHENMRFDARRKIVNVTKFEQLHDLPHFFRSKYAEEEAWRLMKEGRLLYTELPKVLQVSRTVEQDVVSDSARHKLSFNNPYATKSKKSNNQEENLDSMQEDNTNGDAKSAAAFEAEVKKETTLNEVNRKWKKMKTEDGHVYYFNQVITS